MSRFTCQPVGFPKTKVGNWKFPAIFSDEKVMEQFCHEWYNDRWDMPTVDCIAIPREELIAEIEDIESESPLVAHFKNRITDDLKEVWSMPKGHFLIREF